MTKEEIIITCNELFSYLEDLETVIEELKSGIKTALRKAEYLPSEVSDIEDSKIDDSNSR